MCEQVSTVPVGGERVGDGPFQDRRNERREVPVQQSAILPVQSPRWTLLVLGLAVLAGLTDGVRGEDWPQFRGLNASGVSSSPVRLPVEFSFEHKMRWQAQLGDGVSCPIVSRGRVFATGMADELRKLAVMAFDAADGAPLWRREFDVGKLPRITPPNSHASSTPATDGERVYVYFSTLGLLALDAKSGDQLWHEM